MSEETYGEVWEREQREGMPIRKALWQAWYDYRGLLLIWPLAPIGILMGTFNLPWQFWVGIPTLLTGMKIIEVGKGKREFNGMMTIARSLQKGEKP